MTTPDWYDATKLKKIYFEKDERGWAVDMGNETYRLVNNPICSMCDEEGAPGCGDLVKLNPDNGDDSWLIVIEKYVKEKGE